MSVQHFGFTILNNNVGSEMMLNQNQITLVHIGPLTLFRDNQVNINFTYLQTRPPSDAILTNLEHKIIAQSSEEELLS